MDQSNRCHTRVGPDTALCSAIAACAFVWAWLASGPWLASGLNWDTASYVALYASGQGLPTQLPWNSHYGLGPVYALGGWVARLTGGTWIDGVRALNATALAVAAFALARFGHRQAGVAGALWSLVYTFAWGVAQLLLTLEDNVLYLPFATSLLILALRHSSSWTARRSIAAGLLGACGVLVSWQAGLYLFPALYVAAVAPRESWRVRVRDVALVLGTTLLTLVVFVLVFRLWAQDGLRALYATLFSRPSPSFFPASVADLAALWMRRRQVLAQLGGGFIGQVGLPLPPSRWLPAIGAAALTAIAFVMVRFVRRGAYAACAVLAATCAAVTAATALYLDLPADAHKRYEFVPLFATTAAILLTSYCKDGRRVMAGLALFGAVAGLAIAVVQARGYRQRLPYMQPTDYHGHGTEPWFVRLRRLRAAHPEACLFTLPLTPALLHGRYQLEIPAALWSELPAHQLVGDPTLVQMWPRRVNVVPSQRLPAPLPCEWRQPTL